MRNRALLRQQTHEENKLKILKAYERAYMDAMATGYGFIVVKQNNKLGITVTYAPWLDVKAALEDLGAIGALGGKGL